MILKRKGKYLASLLLSLGSLFNQSMALGHGGEESRQDDHFLRRFELSENSYCDARLIASTWGVDTRAGKIAIGYKIGRYEDQIANFLEEGRRINGGNSDFFCSFYEDGYTYGDLQVLSQHWGQSVIETKLFVNKKLFFGGKDFLDSAVRLAYGI